MRAEFRYGDPARSRCNAPPPSLRCVFSQWISRASHDQGTRIRANLARRSPPFPASFFFSLSFLPLPQIVRRPLWCTSRLYLSLCALRSRAGDAPHRTHVRMLITRRCGGRYDGRCEDWTSKRGKRVSQEAAFAKYADGRNSRFQGNLVQQTFFLGGIINFVLHYFLSCNLRAFC